MRMRREPCHWLWQGQGLAVWLSDAISVVATRCMLLARIMASDPDLDNGAKCQKNFVTLVCLQIQWLGGWVLACGFWLESCQLKCVLYLDNIIKHNVNHYRFGHKFSKGHTRVQPATPQGPLQLSGLRLWQLHNVHSYVRSSSWSMASWQWELQHWVGGVSIVVRVGKV